MIFQLILHLIVVNGAIAPVFIWLWLWIHRCLVSSPLPTLCLLQCLQLCPLIAKECQSICFACEGNRRSFREKHHITCSRRHLLPSFILDDAFTLGKEFRFVEFVSENQRFLFFNAEESCRDGCFAPVSLVETTSGVYLVAVRTGVCMTADQLTSSKDVDALAHWWRLDRHSLRFLDERHWVLR